MGQTHQRLSNAVGVLSILISLSFWFASLPQIVPGVHLLNGVSITTYLLLWIVAFILALIPVSRGSRWWILALLLPFMNLGFVVLVALIGEWMASRPG